MSTMNESEKELYKAVHAMTFADIRNELQLYIVCPLPARERLVLKGCLSTNDNNWRRNLHRK
jgi:hypothetical protein